MKIFVIHSRSGNGRKICFFSEREFLKRAKKIDKNKILKIFEATEIESYSDALQYINGVMEETRREVKFSSILDGDDFSENFIQVKQIFLDWISTQVGMYSTLRKDLETRVNLVRTKEDFKDLINFNSFVDILLFKIPPSVEFYQMLLKCHNFQVSKFRNRLTSPKVPRSRYVQNSQAHLDSIEKRIEIFEQAKKLNKKSSNH